MLCDSSAAAAPRRPASQVGRLLSQLLSWLVGMLGRLMCPQNMLRWIYALLGQARHAHSADQPVLNCMLLMLLHDVAVYAACGCTPPDAFIRNALSLRTNALW